jgi:hypothetical protein
MFPIDYQVNVRRGKDVTKYVLLENQDDQYLVVVHPSVLDEMMHYMKRENANDDGLIALLCDEATVLERKRGTVVPMEKANEVLANSQHPAIRRASTFRNELPEWSVKVTGEDLAWAFGLEVAKRRLAA